MDKLGLTNWIIDLAEDGPECEQREAEALCEPRPDALALSVSVGEAIAAGKLSAAELERVACHEAVHAVLGRYRGLARRLVTTYVSDTRAAPLIMEEFYALENEAVDSIARAMVGGD